jgi:hypothetical protein
MRQSRLSGSVEGVMGNHDSYSDSPRALVGWHHQSLLGAREPTLLWNHFAHPMREDVKQKHFATPLRETSIGACIQAPSSSWRGFWF